MNPKRIANPTSNFSITSKRRPKTASTVTNLLSSLSLSLPLRISTPSTNHQTMGGKRGRTQRRHFKENRENVWKKNRPTSDTNLTDNNDTNSSPNPTTHTPWEAFATRNIVFEEYYKEQGIVSEEEWDAFMNMLRKPLPAAFRINSSGQFWEDIRSQLENDFMTSLEAEENEDGELDAIRPLPWYPDNLAWHSNYSRMQLRKNQTLKRFHEFLKQANEIGNITRQEAVSMVPPLFLDVHPDHFVIDMCAAPGSKTFQLLEIIHQTSDSAFLPTGMVIANDVDVQRCNLLIHQTKRMCSANLIVTNHEAQHFPGCHVNHNTLSKSDTASVNGLGMNQLVFDRVLCDVPCSGDGTLRKAPDIWRKWNSGLGNGVHRLQVQIAMRGIALLKVGGRMVYSTCSMNPVENEAVVAEVLRRCGHSVELLDVSTELTKLTRRPGLKKWKVRDRGQWLTSYKDVSEYRKKCGIVPSMFPSGSTCNSEMSATGDLQVDMGPTDNNCERGSPTTQKTLQNSSTVDTEDVEQSENCTIPTNVVDIEVSSLPLERCMRIVPHDQNSGAFFIAVFQKLSSLPVVLEGNSNLSERYTNQDRELPKVSEEIREDINELDINPSEGDTNNQKSVIAETVDADIEDKKSEGAIELDIDSLDGESNEVESKVHGDGETGHDKEKGGKRRLQIQGKWKGVDPVVMFQDEAAISSIRAFYGISESFPFNDHLVARNYDAQRVKRIYYISKSVQDVLKLNIQVGQRLKITSIGLKTFERQTSQEGNASACAYRISSEGLPLLLPYITKQILRASYVDFKHLLQYRTIKFADFVDSGFGENASKLMLGCCVILLNKGDEANSDPIMVDASILAVGCWKGKTNVSVMLSPADCEELLGRLSVRFENKNKEVIHDNKGSIESETTEQATVD